jgi:hypothetical protein
MALELIYDNGVPPLSPAVSGWNGPLLDYDETNGSAIITFEAGATVVFNASAGDVAVIYNTADLQEFGVFYVTGPTMGEDIGDFPVTVAAKIDKNFYDFSKRSGQTYMVVIYSVSLYSDSVANYAKTYRITSSVEKAHYSDLMIAYSKKISHILTVDNLRRNFWNSKDALMADTIFIVEECNEKAYKISINDSTFEIFNDKFKSSVSFNLASSKV